MPATVAQKYAASFLLVFSSTSCTRRHRAQDASIYPAREGVVWRLIASLAFQAMNSKTLELQVLAKNAAVAQLQFHVFLQALAWHCSSCTCLFCTAKAHTHTHKKKETAEETDEEFPRSASSVGNSLWPAFSFLYFLDGFSPIEILFPTQQSCLMNEKAAMFHLGRLYPASVSTRS